MPCIHLIRHAAYEGYERDVPRFVGRTDPPLSAEGREEARAFGRSNPDLSDLPMFSSTARRAYKTATLAYPEAVVRRSAYALEINYGSIDGLSVVEAGRLYPELLRMAGPASWLDYRPFQGECLSDLFVRVDAFIREISGYPEVAIFSHGIFISAVYHKLIERPAVPLKSLTFCCRVSIAQKSDGAWTLLD